MQRSNHMELEGLDRDLKLIREHSVTVDCIVTDCHNQVAKYLTDKGITQYYNVWHFEKGIDYCYSVQSLLSHTDIQYYSIMNYRFSALQTTDQILLSVMGNQKRRAISNHPNHFSLNRGSPT